MARKPEHPDALEELNSRIDQLAHWAIEHRMRFLGALAAILVGAASYGIYDATTTSQELEAAEALAELETGYRRAMGAEPDAMVVEEPANAELASRVRREFAESFRELASEHGGTAAAVVARLEAGNRSAELGEVEAALEAFQAASEEAPNGSPLQGLVLIRLGRALEQQGRFAEAAETFERAGGIEALPVRYQALADAARSYANAGEDGRAVALYHRIEAEAPDAQLPDHVRSRLRELQARVSAPAPGTPADDS